MARKTISFDCLGDLLPPEPAPAVRPPLARKPKADSGIDYLSVPISEFTFNATSTTTVPNEYPTLTQQYRIAIIGENPSRDDELNTKPFSGVSGQTLTNLLSKAGVVRAACFLGNLTQHFPYKGDFTEADPHDVSDGIDALTRDLARYQPNICLLLGRATLALAKTSASLDSWRGSLFISDKPGPFFGRKCIASYEPKRCFAVYEYLPLLMFDIKKCVADSYSLSLVLPQRALTIHLTCEEITNRLTHILQSHVPISIDIEGGINSMSCISIATSALDSFIIPFTTASGDNYWTSFEDELSIWSLLADVLAAPLIPKTLQNALYDRFVLQYSYSLCICNNNEDTMLKSWELYCELEKGLGFLCSLYTKEPYYKGDRKSDDMDTFWCYCCRDSAVTAEIAQKILPMLSRESIAHYNFNVELLNPLLYMELRGILYDTEKAKERLVEVNQAIYKLQFQLDQLAKCGVRQIETCKTADQITLDRNREILKQVSQVMCFVKDQTKPKKDYETIYPEIQRLLCRETPITQEEESYISIEAGWSMNLKSPKFKTYLYETLQLPVQYKEDKDGKKVPTTDGKALLKLKKKSDHAALDLAIQIGELRTRSQMLHISADEDGRIRCGYNVVGAATGRITCYTSPTGSGYNLQTIPDNYEFYPTDHPLHHGMRDLFLADVGYHMFQCDLKGSDGWTIGANLATLGDPTMLDDLRAGIKPASRICYMLRHGNGSLLRKHRDEVKELLKEVKKTDWDYFFCKVGIWGVCYLMGVDLLGEECMEESQGKLVKSRSEIEDFRNAVMQGYNIKLWHTAMAARLYKKPELIVPSGHKRRFFSRKADILGQALAHEPQAVTTYATNLAAWKLWRDPDNRVIENGKTKLRAEPLHQVHDALIGQFKYEDSEWATNKIRKWFDNPITIAGINITIPFEGNFGVNWADLNEGTI